MKKILIIEDEPAYAKLLYEQLTLRKYNVINAYDGDEGLAKAKKEQPDLILLDIRMPKMDGMAAMAMLRKNDIAKHIKIILLTNLEPDEEITSNVVRDQPSYYFVKSDTKFDDLVNKIDQLLSD